MRLLLLTLVALLYAYLSFHTGIEEAPTLGRGYNQEAGLPSPKQPTEPWRGSQRAIGPLELLLPTNPRRGRGLLEKQLSPQYPEGSPILHRHLNSSQLPDVYRTLIGFGLVTER